jgi:2-iminobutanoate/2-iminopropanoate deaminase
VKRRISTDQAPQAEKILSQAMESNGLIFVSGQVHVTPAGDLIIGSAGEMLEQVMRNIQSILEAAGAGLNDVVKVTIYVTDMALLPELNKSYPSYFQEPFPAREAVCVKELPLGADIEISVVAHR